MTRKGSLSDFWRQDASDDRVRELTSVLRGSDSLIGVMGSGVRAVWSTNGQSETWWVRTKQGKPTEMRVFLDYKPLRELMTPFKGEAVDEVIGYAAHEGGHCLWSSGTSKEEVELILAGRITPRSKTNIPQAVEEILRVENILEDAFIDYHVGDEWPVLGEYIRIARQRCGSQRPIDLDLIARDAKPSYNYMLNLWIACSLYDYPLPVKMSAKVHKAMSFLMGKSIEAVRTSNATLRLQLAVACWDYLTANFPKVDDPLPKQAPPPKPQPQQEKSEQGEEGEQGEGEEGEQGEEGEESGAGGDGGPGETGEGSSQGKGKGDTGEKEAEDGKGEDGEGGEEEADSDGAGGDGDIDKEGEAEPEAGAEPEPAPDEPEQEFGHFSGEGGEQPEEGEAEEGGEQGGDEQGAPGNLDEFDIRDVEEIPEELLEEIMDAIAHELEDLSQSVAAVINQPIGNVDAQTKKADYDSKAASAVREQVEHEIQEMQRVFDRQAQVKSRYLSGLTVGKLDRRNLARVGAGNLRVFKRREVLSTPDLAVGLLLDVSGSMRHSMNYVWATACVFAEGLIRKRGVNFLALTYTGGFFDVQTTRICDREMGRLCLGNVEQGGGTPSGPAIASLKVLMDRMPERQKVIIHFTDGDPDDKASVLQAVGACRNTGYSVWAISLNTYARMLEQQYGDGNWETIGSISELPGKVAQLVQKMTASR
ncbi:hypothetical protein LCGC14_1540310 [marine sediment metagenome]|uniref:VWFA domain-containing protein n=1 Tax=marine sediment metagenome TaxID=412755 RepID=A0A0F9JE72_9ZZZZ